MTNTRALAVLGDPEDINCWSNIPYFFLRAGKRADFFQLGVPLDIRRLRLPRLLWNARAPLRMERMGGFQYTRQCMEILMEKAVETGPRPDVAEIVSHFQLFPPYEKSAQMGIRFAYYIDFPLQCLFNEYGIAQTIGKKTAQIALEREIEQYAAAHAVVCMSHWSARQVIERCGVSSQKVHVILPGANLPEEAFLDMPQESPGDEDIPDGKRIPLRIGFVGRTAERKGLPQLVEGVEILARRGFQSLIRVIGPAQNQFRNNPRVQHLGFINKAREPLRLIRELHACHIGALPSRQEAFGIAALEYLRCGLPALLTNVGGLQESVPDDCAIFLSANCMAEEIADRLEDLLKRPEYFARLRRQARLKAPTASWSRTIGEFQLLWQKLDRGLMP